ncbi:MAG: TonB-dependent receptor [Myxococcales bacterium]|nr:TonB-dependent receptor [Myxococcales bacterium]
MVGAYAGAFAQVRFYRRERTLPFAPYGTVIGSPDNTAADTLGMLEGGYTRELSSRLTATARLYANAYRYRDRLVLDDGTFTDIGDSRWGGGEARGRYAVLDGDRLGVTAGAEVTFISTHSQALRPTARRPTSRWSRCPRDFNLAGLYTEIDAKPLPWLALTAGVRADRHSVLEDRVSPRAALFVSAGDRYGAKLLYAEGFRNPSAYEAFFEDGVDFIAQPDIGAETIRSYEAVVWARPRRA